MFILVLKLAAIAMIWGGIRFDNPEGVDNGFIMLSMAWAASHIESKIKSAGRKK